MNKKRGEGSPLQLGALLRHSRLAKAISQLDLALRLEVSQRHVSYLERGRARPSRSLLLAWMREVDAPLSIRNAALLQADYAPILQEVRDDELSFVQSAKLLSQMIGAHDPFPGICFAPDMTIVELNRGGQWLCSAIMPELWATVTNGGAGLDMIAALTAPGGMFSRMRNVEVAGPAMLKELRAKVWTWSSLKPRVDALALWLEENLGVTCPDDAIEPANPHLNLTFDTRYGPLSFFRIQGLFGIQPQDLTIASLRTELWFPSDQSTRNTIQRLAPSGTAGRIVCSGQEKPFFWANASFSA